MSDKFEDGFHVRAGTTRVHTIRHYVEMELFQDSYRETGDKRREEGAGGPDRELLESGEAGRVLGKVRESVFEFLCADVIRVHLERAESRESERRISEERLAHPARAVVPTRLCTTGKLRVDVGLLAVAQRSGQVGTVGSLVIGQVRLRTRCTVDDGIVCDLALFVAER